MSEKTRSKLLNRLMTGAAAIVGLAVGGAPVASQARAEVGVDYVRVLPQGLTLKINHHFECRDANGSLKWEEDVANLTMTLGANDILQKYFAGSAYTAANYVGLKGTGTIAASDTMASHAGWAEVTPYSGARPTYTVGSAASGSIDNSASKAVFAITATATVAGAFLSGNSTAGGTTGLLVGASDFASSRGVISGDTLSVTVTYTLS